MGSPIVISPAARSPGKTEKQRAIGFLVSIKENIMGILAALSAFALVSTVGASFFADRFQGNMPTIRKRKTSRSFNEVRELATRLGNTPVWATA